jgi:hypothetical protein
MTRGYMMKITKTTVFPALLALSLFGAVHAYAGPDGDKNGEPPAPTDTGGGGDVDKGGGDPGTGTGGGDHVDKGGGDPTPPTPPDNHTKVDPPPEPPTPPTPPNPRPRPDPRPDTGNTDTDKKRHKRLVCVIGDQRFYVRYRSECVGPRVVYRDPGVIYAQPRKRVRTVRYAAPCNCAAARVTYGNSSGDIVIGGGTRFIGSPAAVSQARKRAKRQLQYGGGYAYGGGYSVGGGYAYGGGYGYSDGGGYYEQAPVVRRKAKRLRRVRVQAYNPYPVYDPGVVVHYGPAIMKDGAY